MAAEIHRRVAQLMAWSLKSARQGVFPSTGFDGESFDPKSLRFKLKGQPLSRGLRLGLAWVV